MQQLTEHEKKILELVRKHPEIVDDRSVREKVAGEAGITEKTLRNRIADLKRYGLVGEGVKKVRKVGIDVRQGNGLDRGDYLHSSTQDIDLVEYIKFLFKQKKWIMGVTGLIAVLSVIVSLLLPNWYLTTAVILPPGGGESTGLGALISDLPIANLGLFSSDEEANVYLAILKSRSMATEVVNKFELVGKYGVDNTERAIRVLENNVSFEISDEGTISVSVMDKDREIVADMANFYVEELDRINKRLTSEKARNNRIFIDSRVNQTKEELKTAEDNMKKFQEEHGVIAIETQTEEVIRAAAELKAQIMATEVQLDVMEKSVNVNNPSYTTLKLQLTKLREKYDGLKFRANGVNEQDIFQPLFDVPELGLQYARLLSEIKLLSTILEFLLPEYEQAKIQEARDTPTVQFLDRGVTPEEKYKPKRSLIVIACTLLGGFLSVVYVTFRYSAEVKKIYIEKI